MKHCVIVGSSGHSHSVLEAIESGQQYKTIGFLDDFRVSGEMEHGLPILGNIDNCAQIAQTHNASIFFLAVGDNWGRRLLHDKIKNLCPSAIFPGLVHPETVISKTVTIPDACVILPGTVVGRCARLGIGCLLNHQSCLDHDASLGDYASLGPQAAIGGQTHIGMGSAICMGARVHHQIKIGSYSVIGSGSIVNKDIPDQVVAYGTPCVVKRSRNIWDPIYI